MKGITKAFFVASSVLRVSPRFFTFFDNSAILSEKIHSPLSLF